MGRGIFTTPALLFRKHCVKKCADLLTVFGANSRPPVQLRSVGHRGSSNSGWPLEFWEVVNSYSRTSPSAVSDTFQAQVTFHRLGRAPPACMLISQWSKYWANGGPTLFAASSDSASVETAFDVLTTDISSAKESSTNPQLVLDLMSLLSWTA
jgi:hypothetical protein